jgi:hypothetical protein
VLADGVRESCRLGTLCPEPAAWAGRWKFLKDWTKAWNCERHANDLVGAKRLALRDQSGSGVHLGPRTD